MKFDIIKSAATALNKTGFKVKQHSPEILAAAGVVSIIGSVVLACRATVKAQDILEDTAIDVEAVHTCLEDEEIKEQYSEEDSKKDLAVIYVKSGLKIAKTYAPAVAMLGLGLGCMLKSNNILHKRNVAIAAAYTAIDKGFKEYRGRVVDRFGDDVDQELRYGIKAKQIVEEVTNEETGKTKKEKKTVKVVDSDKPSVYAKFFDEGSREWKKDAGYNLMFLTQVENWANERLVKKGHLFLNEVYDLMGLPRTTAGTVVGWIYDLEKPNGDNEVKLIGLYDIYSEAARDFVNGYEPRILIDFNVDGVIYDKIEMHDYIW
jgi:hypothetical protein